MRRTAVIAAIVAGCVCAAAWAQEEPTPADSILGDPSMEESLDEPLLEAPPEGAAEALAQEEGDKRLSDEQAEVAQRFHDFEQLLLRMAELTEATDPRQATLLRRAVGQSKQRLIGRQFDDLVELVRGKELARAIENQSALNGDLKALLELLLSENREKRIESEKARLREYLKRLNRIISEQKSIQGRTAGDDDADKLSQDQGKLAGRTGELSDDMHSADEASRPGDPSDGDSPRAGEGKPGEDSQQGDPPSSKPGESQPGQSSPESNPAGEKPSVEPEEGDPPADASSKPGAQPMDDASEDSQPGQQGQPSDQGQQGQQGQQAQESQQSQQGQQGQESDPNQQSEEQNPARERLDAARKRMEAARKRLEEAKRADAVQEQEEAIRELEEAKAELEEILRQLREEEIERMLARLEARFRHMLDLQREVYEGTQRLDGVAPADRTPSHAIDAGRLAAREAEILSEADRARLLLREDGTAVAFPEAVDQMRADMAQVHERLTAADVGKMTQGIEEDIIAALEEMIEALVRAQKELQDRQQQQQSDQQGQPQDEPLVDTLAELKMIRALQIRVNRRTDRYVDLLQGADADRADILEALDRLAERQQRIYRITRDLHMGKNQ